MPEIIDDIEYDPAVVIESIKRKCLATGHPSNVVNEHLAKYSKIYSTTNAGNIVCRAPSLNVINEIIAFARAENIRRKNIVGLIWNTSEPGMTASAIEEKLRTDRNTIPLLIDYSYYKDKEGLIAEITDKLSSSEPTEDHMSTAMMILDNNDEGSNLRSIINEADIITDALDSLILPGGDNINPAFYDAPDEMIEKENKDFMKQFICSPAVEGQEELHAKVIAGLLSCDALDFMEELIELTSGSPIAEKLKSIDIPSPFDFNSFIEETGFPLENILVSIANEVSDVCSTDIFEDLTESHLDDHDIDELMTAAFAKDAYRSTLEFALIAAQRRKGPIMGICRGAQIIHVYNGGKLANVEGQLGPQTVDVIDGSEMITPKESQKSIIAQSIHHQAMIGGDLTGNLQDTSYAGHDDSRVVKSKEQQYGMPAYLYQFHPELSETAAEEYIKIIIENLFLDPEITIENFSQKIRSAISKLPLTTEEVESIVSGYSIEQHNREKIYIKQMMLEQGQDAAFEKISQICDLKKLILDTDVSEKIAKKGKAIFSRFYQATNANKMKKQIAKLPSYIKTAKGRLKAPKHKGHRPKKSKPKVIRAGK